MAFSLNKVCLAGRVIGKPEVRALENGKRLANITVATTETLSRGDTREERHRVVVLSETLIDTVIPKIGPEQSIYIEGKLTHRSYTDRNGHAQNSTEIVLTYPSGVARLIEPSVVQQTHQDKVLHA